MLSRFTKSASLSRKLILLNLVFLSTIFGFTHFFVLPQIESMFIESHKTKIKHTVEIVDNLVKYYHLRSSRGEFTQDEAKRRAKEIIKNLRYNEKEYFWIHDKDLKMVMHPTNPSLDGTDISQKKDPNGLALFAEMNKTSAETGEGYVQYMWPRPGSTAPEEKYSFVKVFRPWGWVIGNGIYLDELGVAVSKLRYIVYGGLGIGVILSCIAIVFYTNSIVRRLKKSLEQVEATTLELASLSSELTKTGQNVTTGASIMTMSLSSTSESMGEIEKMSKWNEKHSRDSETWASACLANTRDGKQTVEQLIGCMDEISKANTMVLEQNGQSSERITHIIELIRNIGAKAHIINEIVFQTKILSFNASVEASRAGEAGKGFSVVAEEIGKLAHMSGSAACSIEESLRSSIAEVENIVKEDLTQSRNSISVATDRIEEGRAIVKKCGSIFDVIVENVNQVAEVSNNISGSCQKQRAGIEEINQALVQLDQTSQLNSVSAKTVEDSVVRLLRSTQEVQSNLKLIHEVVEGEVNPSPSQLKVA